MSEPAPDITVIYWDADNEGQSFTTTVLTTSPNGVLVNSDPNVDVFIPWYRVRGIEAVPGLVDWSLV